jgi:hypothetical protein
MTFAFLQLGRVLGVRPGTAVGERCDAVFQCDAGQRIADIRTQSSSFGFGSHALMHTLWPRTLGKFAALFPGEPDLPWLLGPLTVSLAMAGGFTLFMSGLRAVEVPAVHRILFFMIVPVLTSNCVAVLPDHFGISVGILTAAFGCYLLQRAGQLRYGLLILLLFVPLASGVCITNGLFPLGLACDAALQRYRPNLPAKYYLMALLASLGLFAGAVAGFRAAGEHAPVAWQVNRWLNLRVVNDPPGAVKRWARAWVEPVFGPTPAVDTNNYFEKPMLTYEPRNLDYAIWPYRGWEHLPAIAWCGLVAAGLYCGIRSTRQRRSIAVLVIWIAWNSLFHTIWGDEFFLYSPHYGWAVWCVPLLGLAQLRARGLMLPVMIVLVGCTIQFLAIAERARSLPMG